jgi:parallel beta-helix repeat protein
MWKSFKDINDMQEKHIISVKDFGATGDGVTDDTRAIKDAYEYSMKKEKILFFPNGVYLVSNTLHIRSGANLIGAKWAILKKDVAVTQKITEDLMIGDKFCFVEDASQYVNSIGKDMYIGSTWTENANGTVGKITSVNVETNRIDFITYLSSDGCRDNYSATDPEIVFSTSHPIITTDTSLEDSEDMIIEGLTFDAQAQPDEPNSYILSCIHLWKQQPKKASNVFVRNNTILNSNADGISVQNSGDTTVENNRVYNCKFHGIHIGFTTDRNTIRNNIVENCGRGLFWCYGTTDTIVTNNFFKNCGSGCFGMDLIDVNSYIGFNSFINCDVAIRFTGNRTIVHGNLFRDSKEYDINIYTSIRTIISENIIWKGGSNSAISIEGGNTINIVNNHFYDLSDNFGIKILPRVGGSNHSLIIDSNLMNGNPRECISIMDTNIANISNNSLQSGIGKTITINDKSKNIIVKNNMISKEVENLSTNNVVVSDNLIIAP